MTDFPRVVPRTRGEVSGMAGSASHGFGAVVRDHRIAAGLTQEELAERTGMSVRAIGDIERGRTARPRRSTVELLERTLRLSSPVKGQVAETAAQSSQERAGQEQSSLERAGLERAGQERAGQERASAQRIVPRQLPATIRHFVGRAAELATLTRLLGELDGTGGAVAISAVGGTAGVGKTALAVRWAHLVADRFPDGQLYVNLRGYDPDQPVAAADALAGFLRALGVPGQDIPPTEDERAAQYRTLLAGRRVLVILDNASGVEQVRPLLPGTPACAVVVTSRDALNGLAAWHDARRLELDLLPAREAIDLLRALVGPRVDADPEAAAELAAQCSRLPLALRMAAELAASRPSAPLAALVSELADQQRRLDLLDGGGDPRTAVRAVFSWSCRHLTAPVARTFRLLSLHPGSDLDAYAAAALTGCSVEDASRALGQLARAHLIQATGTGRYSMHDLLRAYAAGQVASQDGEQERQAALTRLFDWYLYAVREAMDLGFPAERHRRPEARRTTTPAPPLAGAASALAWLDAERETLIAVSVHTSGHGWPGHAIRLAATLFSYLDAGRYLEAISIHGHACYAARHNADRAGEAVALTHLALAHGALGRYQQARGQLRRALRVFRGVGDPAGEASAVYGLGSIDLQQGRYQPAHGRLQQALTLYRAVGDRHGEARALSSLGVIDRRQGRYQQAADRQHQALTLFRQTGDRVREGETLYRLGVVGLWQGSLGQADVHLRLALALFIETGDPSGQAEAHKVLGDVDLRQGHYQEATEHHRRALTLFRKSGDPAGEADALNGLGQVSLALGEPRRACRQHAAALTLAIQIGDQHEQANAHQGLGHAFEAMSDSGQARHHWHQALTLYTRLGAPEAGPLRVQLTTPSAGSPPVNGSSAR
ncbi:MAG TPA: tetratricopeptide repeat protein [Streptosporangiaceae bacterium]|nr:tetratricopeptide repeat protein [Streptosporangiaceae bacterium]